MGRTLSTSSGSNFSPDAALPPSLLLAGTAASIAILFALCVSHHRKPSWRSQPTSPSPNEPPKNSSITPTTGASTKPPSPQPPEETHVHEVRIKPALLKSPSPPRRKLTASLSMRLPEGLSRIRTRAKSKGKLQSADDSSVWKKRIILGERCKIPSSDDEDEITLYDDKGNKQRNYHPRTSRSLPVSRTCSFAVADPNIDAS